MGFIGLGLSFCVARGPWENRWVGWRGGWRIHKKISGAAGPEEEKAMESDVAKSAAIIRPSSEKDVEICDGANEEGQAGNAAAEGAEKR